MNNLQSLEKMGSMRLLGMQQAFKACLENNRSEAYTNDELVHYLVESEWEDRHWRRQQRNLKSAGFRYQAVAEQLDYDHQRGLDKNSIERLLSGEFIRKGEDLFITGPTGTGKSFLATAIGYQACMQGYRVLYASTSRLMSQLKVAKAGGAHLKELSKIASRDVLILDDFGVQPLDASARAMLLDIIEDRHAKHTTIITTQLPVKKWHEVIGEKTIADAILDRIVHQTIRIELYGESMRKKKIQKDAIADNEK